MLEGEETTRKQVSRQRALGRGHGNPWLSFPTLSFAPRSLLSPFLSLHLRGLLTVSEGKQRSDMEPVEPSGLPQAPH